MMARPNEVWVPRRPAEETIAIEQKDEIKRAGDYLPILINLGGADAVQVQALKDILATDATIDHAAIEAAL